MPVGPAVTLHPVGRPAATYARLPAHEAPVEMGIISASACPSTAPAMPQSNHTVSLTDLLHLCRKVLIRCRPNPFLFLSQSNHISLTDVLCWCEELAVVLAHLHDQAPAIIHLDIKMENVGEGEGSTRGDLSVGHSGQGPEWQEGIICVQQRPRGATKEHQGAGYRGATQEHQGAGYRGATQERQGAGYRGAMQERQGAGYIPIWPGPSGLCFQSR